MHDTDAPRAERSLTDSVIRIFESGQRVILDRLDLAYFDLSQLVVRTLHGAALIVVGSVLLPEHGLRWSPAPWSGCSSICRCRPA